MPREPGRRRFLMLDVLIFVFAFAGGFSQSRLYYRDLAERVNAARGLARALDVVTLTVLAAEPVAELLAIALIVVRLIPPRPELRELARQPGLMASCNVVLAMVLGSTWNYVLRTHRMAGLFAMAGGARFDPEALELLAFPAMMRGSAVAAAWFTMALTGSLRWEKEWVDWLGIVIGIYFLALIPVWGSILVG